MLRNERIAIEREFQIEDQPHSRGGDAVAVERLALSGSGPAD